MKNNIILSLLLLPAMIFIGQAAAMESVGAPLTCLLELTTEALAAPRALGPIKIFHANKKFVILHEGKFKLVHNYNISSELRGISTEELKRLLSEDNGYITVQRKSDGQFALDVECRLNGGGAGGATAGFYIGKFTVHFLGHGAMLIAAACTGPAAPATFAALEATFLVPLEAASNAIGLGTGIVGAVVTGPV